MRNRDHQSIKTKYQILGLEIANQIRQNDKYED